MEYVSYREIKFTTRPIGIIVRPYPQISVEILSRPPDRAARALHAVRPAAPRASALAAVEHCTTTTLHTLYLAGTF